MPAVCKRVLYSGRVQGVGFRATARAVAARYPVAGYVRNLPSGEVELVAEGEPEAVGQFLEALGRRMGAYVAGMDVRDEPPAGRSGFEVRH
jgi:acylphosphatase